MIYLDYNASSPIDSRVLEMMVDVYKNHYGNADSRMHEYGKAAKEIVSDSRNKVAKLLGINSQEVFFTSGATESNNIVIQGLRKYGNDSGKKHIIISSIEHKAIIESAKALKEYGFEIQTINPDKNGVVNVQNIIDNIRKDTLLVSVMHANNETGVIQPVKEIGDYLQSYDVLFHVDATQTCGKLVEEIREIKYDMMSISAHKMHGPQGVGALILKKKNYKLPPITPLFFGGAQEHGIRPGTLPVALIAGFGKACEIAINEYKHNYAYDLDIKKSLLKLLNESKIDFTINGEQNKCMPNTINISILNVSSEALMLSTKQYCGISNGSACNSNNYNPSHVLVAMGLDNSIIESALRISWGYDTDKNIFINEFKKLIETAKSLLG